MKKKTIGAFLVQLAIASPLVAQSYPEQPIRFIVPYAAGGMTDLVARIIAQDLSEAINKAVIVENKPGVATITGADYVAKSKPDGYTILVATNATLTINPWLYTDLRYNPTVDFKPIALVAAAPSVIVVNPKNTANTLDEFIAKAKNTEQSISYASFGNGSSAHLAGELFRSRTNSNLLHVPYKGSAPARMATVTGEVQLSFEPAFTAAPLIQSGQLKPLAVMSKERSLALPDIPTTAELGFPNMEMQAWVGFVAPSGVPDSVVDLLSEKIVEIVKKPDIQDRLTKSGAEPFLFNKTQFAEYIGEESERYRKIVDEAGIQKN